VPHRHDLGSILHPEWLLSGQRRSPGYAFERCPFGRKFLLEHGSTEPGVGLGIMQQSWSLLPTPWEVRVPIRTRTLPHRTARKPMWWNESYPN